MLEMRICDVIMTRTATRGTTFPPAVNLASFEEQENEVKHNEFHTNLTTHLNLL